MRSPSSFGHIVILQLVLHYRHNVILEAVDLETPPFEQYSTGMWVDIPKPVAPVHVATAPAVPQGPPPPPPIHLKFFGFSNKPGEAKKIFLSQGEDVFIAGEGDIIDRRYRILHITPVSVEVEDVLNNNRQTIPLTQG